MSFFFRAPFFFRSGAAAAAEFKKKKNFTCVPAATCSGACASLPDSGHRPGRRRVALSARSDSGSATERGASAARAAATDDAKADRELGSSSSPFSSSFGQPVMLSASVPSAMPAVRRCTRDTSCSRRYSAARASPRSARRRRASAAARAARAADAGAAAAAAGAAAAAPSAAAAFARKPRSLATAASSGLVSALRTNSAWRRGTADVGGRDASSEAAGHDGGGGGAAAGAEEPFPSVPASRCAAASSGTRESTPHTSTTSLSLGLKDFEEEG